jgi:predicted transcriptional regulator
MASEFNAQEIKFELIRRNISQKSMAETLNISGAAVSKALKGQLPAVLRDIYNFLYAQGAANAEIKAS